MSDDNLKRAALRVAFRRRNPQAAVEVVDGLCDFAMSVGSLFAFDDAGNLTALSGDLNHELESFERLPTFTDVLAASAPAKPTLVADSPQPTRDLATGPLAAQQRENQLVEKIGTAAPTGGRTEAWYVPPLSPESVAKFHNLSVSDFNSLPLPRRMELEGQADGARRGFAS